MDLREIVADSGGARLRAGRLLGLSKTGEKMMKRFKVFSLLLAAAVAATSVPMAVYGAENPAAGASAAVVRTAVTGAGDGAGVSSE